MGSAANHFNDVVSDHESQIHHGQREIELILLGETVGVLDSVEPADIAKRLAEFEPESLAGIRGFVLVRSNAEATVVADLGAGITDAMLAPLGNLANSASPLPNRPWVATLSVDTEDLVAVGASTPSSDSLLAVFDADEFILGGTGSQRHHVRAQLLGPTTTNSSVSDSGRFASTTDVDVFGQTWTLTVTTTEEFIKIPTSQEVAVLATLGIALSAVLFGLVRRLVRSRIAAEDELRLNAERFDTGFERSPIGVAELDENGVMIKVNDAIATLLGLSTRDLIGMSLSEFVTEHGPSESVDQLVGLEHGASERTQAYVKYERRGGLELWIHQSASLISGPGEARHTLVQMVDVTEQHRTRDELEEQALHDELTGLPNRTLLGDRLEQALARARRSGLHTAALFIDVDHFKQINDSLGHSLGDEMLVEIARRLTECARDSDTVARFGGDEFVMLCEDLQSPPQARTIADRVRSTMSTPIELDGREFTVTLSLGIAVASGDDDMEALLRDADLAMYHAKDRGRDCAVLFDQEMRESLVERLTLEDEFRHAIDSNELRVFYQPLFDLSIDRVTGWEALVRWDHPTRGLMAPDQFLPIAEHLSLLTDIDAWVLSTAAAQLQRWSAELVEAEHWSIAVNSSAPDFADPSYPDRVRASLLDTGLDPSRVTIEVTEHSVLANPAIANKVIDDLKAIGITIAIDDFGTGYSSFSQVASLPFDILKIDRSLIRRLGDRSGFEVVRTVIQMAHSLGMTTVAEGVETADDLQLLRTLGSDAVQGHYIAKALPPGLISTELGSRMVGQ